MTNLHGRGLITATLPTDSASMAHSAGYY
jgi:hypothetical protein